MCIHYPSKIKIVARRALPNTACTGRWGVCAVYKHFSGFEFILLPSRVHAHPSASNANRWLASQRAKSKPFLNRTFRFIVEFGKASSVF